MVLGRLGGRALRAAGKGIANAEYAVGYYSEVGIGVPVDAEEAKRWYARAAAQGHERATQRLRDLRQTNAKGANRPSRSEASDCLVM